MSAAVHQARGTRFPINGESHVISKRDGRKERFDRGKIVSAVKRCMMNSLAAPEGAAEDVGQDVSRKVENILAHNGAWPAGVEDVQRLVIQQLWAGGHFDAAEQYQNHREEHRKARETRPISPEFARAVAEDSKHFPTDLQYYQFIGKFSRWREEDQRRETWRESCTRVLDWFKKQPRVRLTEQEWAELDASLYGLETCCAMRVLQMAGPALDRCNVGAYNCSYHPLQDQFAFVELLYILMQGTGSGFSVESEYVAELPKVRRQRKRARPELHKIDDSTEGWCDAYKLGLERWWDGYDVEYDASGVRKAGTRLKTKGGRASGPEPLLELLRFARHTVLSRQGSVLTDLDCHDLACVSGKIVQVGGVRRASCISISDLMSQSMREAKYGDWYNRAKWRTMANNSAAYDGRPDAVTFMREWLSLAESGSGERGIFNRKAVEKCIPKRRKQIWEFGMNPCGEILLRPFEFCNLSIVVARPWDTKETLKAKVRVAAYWGCMQKTCTNFKYLRPDWKKNCEEEALLGVDITGHADCPLLRYGAPGRAELLRELRQVVADTDEMLSKRWGVSRSAADTCVKPSGDSSVFFDCGSGISARFAAHQIRWVRESIHSPVAALLVSEGVPHATAPEDDSLLVFGFPKKAPEGATLRNDLTAIQQLENWLEWKQNWAEHSVACTIYVEPHEWLAVGNWCLDHFDDLTGLSFLPKDNGIYSYAPNEEITKEQYDEMVAKFPKISWAKLCRFEHEDKTETARAYACVGDKCELG
jgi:ribonucleoside-triphosphate reductase (thioredoxin)